MTPREQRVLSFLREGLSDEQIAGRLSIDLATVEHDISSLLSKLGLESRAQIAVSRPPQTAPAPELEPPEPGPDGPAASAPGAPRRMGLRLAAQIFGTGLALIGIGLVAWGLMRMAGDDDSQSAAAVRTASPAEISPHATNQAPTITPFPAVVAEEPVAFGQFGFRRSLYSVRPDGSDLHSLLPNLPRAYAWSPEGTQLAYVQSYGDIDLKFISAAGDALNPVRLEGVFSVDGLSWPPDGSRIVLSVQVPAAPDASGQATLKNTIALLDVEDGRLTVLDSDPLLPNGLITLPGNPPSVVLHPNSGTALSPDGAYVAWPSGDGQIQIAPVNGETAGTRLAGQFPAWSADSSRVAFQDGAEIHIVDRDGSGEEVLVPGGQPAWAPSDRIAFIRDGDLFVIDPDTGDEGQLTGIDLPFASSPRWSPDGERVFFTYAASVSEIFTVASNGEERTLLLPGSYPQWSPDGGSIAFAAGKGKGNLFLMTPDGEDLTALRARIFLSDALPLDGGCHARPFQWSPLGGRLAVCNAQSGNIDVVGVKGESPILVGTGSSFTWAPDGARIAFTGSEREGALTRPVIYIADVAKPNAPPQRLAEGTTPDWSPDGAKIAYVAADGLHVAAVDGSDDTLVAAGEIARTHVSWSPDSTRIAYVSAGRILIATFNSSGAPVAIIEGLSPQWSPDGTQIAYYTSAPNGQDDLWSVAAAASAPPPRHLGKGRAPTWSPDSARIAYDRFIP